ncbi:hypothetical protein RND81_10G141500 [Saponaria officinalis]|uniref:Anaphase-promoting complex subunit 1 C-terminal domain-containing protein n=1 Tax=Saponaria officinalis TaxID=3572 RepID=A0AAW1I4E1_SAPOF
MASDDRGRSELPHADKAGSRHAINTLKSVRVCGPRYWPQAIELTPQDKPWWNFGDKNHPFNFGILYIKRKVGAYSCVDDPVGCQSLLSRATNKAFRLKSMRYYAPSTDAHIKSGSSYVAQLVSTFSSDPSLIAFAQLCSDFSWNSRLDIEFQEFCLQVPVECVSKDRPALLQVYMSLYTVIRSMTDQVTGMLSSFSIPCLYLILSHSPELTHEFAKLPDIWKLDKRQRSILLSWYLQWFCVPSPSVLQTTVHKIKHKTRTSSAAPLLRLVFPRTHISVISEIDKLLSSGQFDGRTDLSLSYI